MPNGYIETMWAIHGVHGLYTGTYLTRKQAIDAHIYAYDGHLKNRKKGWQTCKKNGDKLVKVTITYTA